MILDVVVSVFYGKGEIVIKDNPDNLIKEIVGIVKDIKIPLRIPRSLVYAGKVLRHVYSACQSRKE